jgi:PTS system galactitol-specific IIA component
VDLGALLVDDLIRLSFGAESWEEVLRRLAQDLCAVGRVHPTYEDAVVARERTFPTGLAVGDIGVAIPHADVEHVREPGIAIATLSAPVAFGEMGNPGQTVPVRIVFMLAIHEAEAMVGVLQDLVGSFQQPGALAAILDATSPEDVRTVFGRALREAAPPSGPAGDAVGRT